MRKMTYLPYWRICEISHKQCEN